MSSSADAVDRLIEAIVRRDIGDIAQCFSLDAHSSQWGVTAPVVGRSEVELMYEILLKTHPQIDIRIADRLVVGDIVVDHEMISGYSHLPAGTIVHKVYVYTVRDGQIVTMSGVTAHP